MLKYALKKENKPIMKEFETKIGTHVVAKVEDIEKLPQALQEKLSDIFSIINERRVLEGKKINDYYVVNLDEPYADKIFNIIKNGEERKIADKDGIEIEYGKISIEIKDKICLDRDNNVCKKCYLFDACNDNKYNKKVWIPKKYFKKEE